MRDRRQLARILRESGKVRRFHTLPHLGEDSIAAHGWNAAALLFALYPEAPRGLILAVLFHDCAERYLGDLPTIVSVLDPEMYDRQQAAEAEILQRLGLRFDLNAEELDWLRIVDKLECWVWCQEELNGFGNKNVLNAIEYLGDWFIRRMNQLPPSVVQFLDSYFWERTSNVLPERT